MININNIYKSVKEFCDKNRLGCFRYSYTSMLTGQYSGITVFVAGGKSKDYSIHNLRLVTDSEYANVIINLIKRDFNLTDKAPEKKAEPKKEEPMKPTTSKTLVPEIKNVIFNGPATIVFWEDGTKTVVRCQSDDEYTKEAGLAWCIAKKALGNKSDYVDIFGKWCGGHEKAPTESLFSDTYFTENLRRSLEEWKYFNRHNLRGWTE